MAVHLRAAQGGREMVRRSRGLCGPQRSHCFTVCALGSENAAWSRRSCNAVTWVSHAYVEPVSVLVLTSRYESC